jgi:heavy metal translocating P-type ATPase
MRLEIRHRLPTRLRVVIPVLRGEDRRLRRVACWLQKQRGVCAVRITPPIGSITLEFDSTAGPAAQSAVIRGLAAADPRRLPHEPTAADSSSPPLPNRFAAASLSLGVGVMGGPASALVTIATLYAAWPTYVRAFDVWNQEQRLNVDVLDGLAIALALLRGGAITAALIVWLLRLGDLIRDRTAASTRRIIEDLVAFESQRYWVVRGGLRIEVLARELAVGDVVVVYAGNVLPVDGRVIKDKALLDQRAITGESLPLLAQRGSAVYAGTSVQEGKLYVKATAVGGDTTVARIVRMVKQIPIGETRVQNYAEIFADRLVIPTLGLSFGLFALSGNSDRLNSMLIVDYGTGIRIAAPTAILASIADAARHGVLIKSGSVVERLAGVNAILFDKTGTLTRGTPRIIDVLSYSARSIPPRKLLSLAAAAEIRHKHPVAQAVVDRARAEQLSWPSRERARFRIGRGVEARVDGHDVWLGSERFLLEKGVSLRCARADLRRYSANGYSTLLLALDGELVGALPYADEIRPEMGGVIRELHARGIRELAMLTGDSSAVAEGVARRLGLDRFFANVLPEEKARFVGELRNAGHTVAMVGDGVNDAAALARADVGIAVKNGTDLTRQVAQVLLMQDNMWRLIVALETATNAMQLVRENFAIIAGLNTLAMALAIPAGLVAPSVTAMISNGSAILATLNAMRPALKYLQPALSTSHDGSAKGG